jgi:hypothetical protein
MSFLNKGLSNEYRHSTRPEPLIPGKHALNPPIVTVIGGGVAGLTAAHELVERGFLVQVVEATEDPYYRERPLVGGMAANQRARVRACVEDLHRDLIDLRRREPEKRVLIDWMMWLFSLNRTRWIQTEAPASICRFVNWAPDDPPAGAPNVVQELLDAKQRYRKRWIWDLTVRGALLHAITAEDGGSALEVMTRLYNDWIEDGPDPTAMIGKIYAYLARGDEEEGDKRGSIPLPNPEHLEEWMNQLVAPAFEREFLCFRLVPRAVQGVPDADVRARSLLRTWMDHILKQDALRHSLLVDGSLQDSQVQPDSGKVKNVAGATRVVHQSEPFHERVTDTFPTSWLQIELIEQRLPGEHGYRFFPSFYRHLDDTMRRIPIADDAGRLTARTVFDNLRPTVFQGLGMSREDLEKLAVDPRRPKGQPAPIDLVTDDPDPTCARAAREPEPSEEERADDLRRRRAPPADARVVEIHRNRAKSIEGFRDRTDRFVQRLGGNTRDGLLFFAKMFRYMTSCSERRRAQYEGDTWGEFVDVSSFSLPMQKHIEAAAQVLLAFSVGEADARTYGNIATQLFLDQFEDGTRTDRTLNGPTSTAWIDPWRDYLERQGVRFFRKKLTGFRFYKNEKDQDELVPEFENLVPDGEEFFSYWNAAAQKAHPPERRPDFYVLALSLQEAADKLATIEKHAALPPELNKVIHFRRKAEEEIAVAPGKKATKGLKDMTGLQFFFDAKTSIGRGHMYFPLSAWGLSSISQSEFWLTRGGFADGYVGVLSVDVCTTDGRDNKAGSRTFKETLRVADPKLDADDAAARGRFEVARQVWWDIAKRIDANDKLAEPRCFHLDSTISADDNKSLFLASTPALCDRPGRKDDPSCVGKREIEYGLHFNRLVVCGTFMATHTRMTTMEAANESARHAVKAILAQLGRRVPRHRERLVIEWPKPAAGIDIVAVDALGTQDHNGAWQERPYDPPDIWNPEDLEMEDLDIFRRIDRRLLDLGLDHFMDIVDFDRKLALALDEAEIYGKTPEVDLAELIGLASAGVDATATKERGRGYAARDRASADKVTGLLDGFAKAAKNRFPDLGSNLDSDKRTLKDLINRIVASERDG